ncbi:putative DNA binding domain-containing protein [Gelidibacter japonicus]|uniref:RNA-binding domain-containing protein n=1 Tax=Gelidibacter japonicus TaxID=1962232 RepID=UPI00202076CA|nr:RNA-binding domain-containing protein [Gelidibacter japonicus]MCL8009364.1 putative DNA binding domain-containing protein [Gelidibacter japonicus]
MKIETLIQQPEGRDLEFKEILPSKADLNKTIVAFANDSGGILLLGIKDVPRAIVGIDESDLFKLEESISASIIDSCSPTILPDISFLRVGDKYLLKIKIAKGNNPPYHLKSKGIEAGTYIRVGSSNRLANQELIEELNRKRNNISFDSLPVYAKALETVNLDTLEKHFDEKAKEKLTPTILKKLNLIYQEHGNNYPTNALILLSDDILKEQIFPYSKIECAKFKGDIPGDFIDQKTIDGPLSIQAEQAYQFVLRHISKNSEFEGVYRKDRWEYPIVALREVIRNAIIHRDYALSGKDIKIAIFDTKIEITSPGNLLPTVDFNEMDSGQSDIRNRILAPIFKKLGIIEQWGNGLQLIANELKDYPEIKFQWSQPGMSFRISFIKSQIKSEKTHVHEINEERLRTTANDYERLRTIANDYEQLSLEQKKILLFLIENEKITRREVTNLIAVRNTKAYEILNAMVKTELITMFKEGRNSYYILKNS